MSRLVAENLKNISIYKFKQWGLLNKTHRVLTSGEITWSRNGEVYSSMGYDIIYNESLPFRLDLKYKDAETEKSYNPKITLSKSECNYGDFRYWFHCPNCERRSAKLYFYNHLPYCRHCLKLSYESNNRSKSYRYMDKVFGFLFEDERGEGGYRKFYAGKPTKRYARKLRFTLTDEDFEAYQNSFRLRGRPKNTSQKLKQIL